MRLMRDESAIQPISVFTQMPSCVPSAPGLETAGARITAGEVAVAGGASALSQKILEAVLGDRLGAVIVTGRKLPSLLCTSGARAHLSA